MEFRGRESAGARVGNIEEIGLGLTVAYAIVQEHGGQIRLESRRGAGASFFVELPIAGPKRAKAPSARARLVVPEPRRSGSVLVVEDEPHLARAVVEALRYAETLSDDVRAVYVDTDPKATEQIRRDWDKWGGRVTLVVLPSPYRSVMEPLLAYITQVETERPNDYVTVILPEFVPARWWQHLLHNQSALLIKGALLFRPNTVVTSVPFHLRH